MTENAPPWQRDGRPPRCAQARRQQYQRARARAVQCLLRDFSALQHRGCQPTALGQALVTALASKDHKLSPNEARIPTCRQPTKRCWHFEKGFCRRGLSCGFRHEGNADASPGMQPRPEPDMRADAPEFVPAGVHAGTVGQHIPGTYDPDSALASVPSTCTDQGRNGDATPFVPQARVVPEPPARQEKPTGCESRGLDIEYYHYNPDCTEFASVSRRRATPAPSSRATSNASRSSGAMASGADQAFDLRDLQSADESLATYIAQVFELRDFGYRGTSERQMSEADLAETKLVHSDVDVASTAGACVEPMLELPPNETLMVRGLPIDVDADQEITYSAQVPSCNVSVAPSCSSSASESEGEDDPLDHSHSVSEAYALASRMGLQVGTPSERLLVAGLPVDMISEDAAQIFNQYGNAGRCVLIPNTASSGTASAFLIMQSSEDAKWIVDHVSGNIPQGLTEPITAAFATKKSST